VSTIYELTVMEQNVIWELVSEARKRLLTAVRPDGFNIGLNQGLAAGQTVIHLMFTLSRDGTAMFPSRAAGFAG
jgi:diadenosine tetraphosphate (Ap4A) HIT family hydrolase